MKLIRFQLPLRAVKLTCITATIAGVFFFATGRWISGLCLLLGAYILEQSRYRCPQCDLKLDMKRPLLKSARCPACGQVLQR